MKILVLQLCRMGDLLQTTPMLRGLRRERPEAEITLVVHDVFRDVPVPSRLFDRKIAFPYTRVAAGVSDAPEDWPAQAAIVRDFIASLGSDERGAGGPARNQTDPFDLILNLTHSDLCGLLATMTSARRIEGGIISRDRVRLVQGPWMSWFWASQTARAQGCFNLVDLHNWAAGVASDRRTLEIDVPDEARADVQAWLAAQGASERPLIAVQLGASEERKRWQPERFAEAVDLLPADCGDIVFVGARSERALVDRAREALAARGALGGAGLHSSSAGPVARRQFHDAVGETSMTELAALLERCRLLLTNDTGTMHIAAAVGTKVVDVSTGPVFVHETGPYGEGHFVIEPTLACFPCAAGSVCHHISCRDAFTPADIAGLAAHALGQGPLPRPAGARISAGVFMPGGRIEYRTLWTAGSDRAETIRQASARMWEETMPTPYPADVAQPFRAAAGPTPGLKAHKAGLKACATNDSGEFTAEHAALGELATHAEAVAGLARRIPDASNAGRAQLSQTIERTLQRIRLLAQTDPVCQPIAGYLAIRLEGVLARDVETVAKVYAEECRDANRRAVLLAQLLGDVASGFSRTSAAVPLRLKADATV